MPERQRKSNVETGSYSPEKVALITTTFYPKWYGGEANLTDDDGSRKEHKVRGDLALEMLRRAKAKGVQIVTVDGGSSEPFVLELKKIGITLLEEKERGMSESRRQGIRVASQLHGVRAVVWTEPEKVSFVDNLEPVVAPIFSGEADMIVPSREPDLFRDTYPDYQVVFEAKSNKRWQQVLRLAGIENSPRDPWFGPRAFVNDPDLIALTQKILSVDEAKRTKGVNPEAWFDATFYPIILAAVHEYVVGEVEILYEHSRKQTNIENNSPTMEKKRRTQHYSILTCAIEALRSLNIRGAVRD